MALDYPDQSYYPAWKARLIVRLEEFGQGVVKARVPPTQTKNLNGVKENRAPLDAVRDPEFPSRFLLKPRSSRATDEDASKGVIVPESSSDGLTHVISGVIPRHFEWKQNGFRTADELTIQVKWVDMPIDPRVIRSCAVEFFLGCLSSVEYAQGVRGVTRGNAFGPGHSHAAEPLNVVADSYIDGNGNRRTNVRFTGWVDKWKMKWASDEPYAELQCRDNTSLLLNQNAPTKLVLGMKEPIDQAIAVYLSNFPQLAGMTVQYVGDRDGTVPKLEGALAGTAFRPTLGPQPSKGSGDSLTVWDYLTDVTGAIGHIVRLDGNAILIQRAATLLHGTAAARVDDPYRKRELSSGEFPSRTFIYGRNVEDLGIDRDFSQKESKNVEVRCYSPRRKQVIVARFPTKEERIASSTPGDERADTKWNIVRVSGIEDPKVLQQIAEDVYHGRNRNEIEVVIKTKNLASFGGGNEDPDILDMKSGDAVEILVDRANPGAIAEHEQKLSAQSLNEEMLRGLGYSHEFAVAYAKAYQDAGFQRLYRAREISISGDVSEGVSIEIRAANFVQARADVPPASPTKNPTASSSASRGGGKTAGIAKPPVSKSSTQVTTEGGKQIKKERG